MSIGLKHFPTRTLFLALVIAVCLIPLLWTLLASINLVPNDVTSPPTWSAFPTLDSYLEIGVSEPNFVLELLTGAALALATTLLTSIVGFFAAFSLARSRFRGRNLVVQSFLILASLPVIAFLIPLSNTLDMLHLTDTFGGIALAETALYAPLVVYVLFGYIGNLSIELEEAAWLDGASLMQVLRQIVLPTATPGIAATAIIVFVLSWNQLLMPLLLATHVRTVPVAMIDFFTFERELDWPTAAAALIASLLPIAVFVAVAHRTLERFSLVVIQQAD
ncbi:MAG: carbohydrate ABC transporter permease [Aggregatilineales bacterium]